MTTTVQARQEATASDAVEGGWVESFNHHDGVDLIMSRWWGTIDWGTDGQITMTGRDGEWFDAGIMVPPTGVDAGNGYGTYRFEFNTHGNTVGDYLLLWAADDASWPDREYDGLEYDFDGNPYSAIHYAGSEGENQADYRGLSTPDFDPFADHVLEMRWEDEPGGEGRLTVYLDGVFQYSTTDHIGKDYAHGGENMAPGVGQQFFWNLDQQSGDNSLTLYEVSYTPIGGTPPGEPPIEEPPPGGDLQARLDALHARFDARRAAAEDALADDPERLASKLASLDAREQARAEAITAKFGGDGGGGGGGGGAEVIDLVVNTTPGGAPVPHYDHGDTINFVGYGDGFALTHEGGETFVASGSNGYDTITIPGEDDLSGVLFTVDGHTPGADAAFA